MLSKTIDQILKDNDYIRENHEFEWSEIVPKLTKLISVIVQEVFKVDRDYVIANPLNPTSQETIAQFIERINNRLLTDFKESPPFTIHHLASILSFKTPGLQFPSEVKQSQDEVPELKNGNGTSSTIGNGNGNAFKDRFSEELEDEGLKSFKVTVKNMITGQQIITTQLNHYYQSPPSTSQPPTPLLNDNGTFNEPPPNNPATDNIVKPTLNEIYAIKFLRSLERSVFVQSTIDDINRDLDGYGSKNTVAVTTVHGNGNGNGRKRGRISTHSKDSSSTEEDDEDDADSPVNGIPANVPTGIKMTRIPWLTKPDCQTTAGDQTVKFNGDSLAGNDNNNNNNDANLTSNDRIEMHLQDEQQQQRQQQTEEQSSGNNNADEDIDGDDDDDEEMESDSPKRHYPGSSRRGCDEERTVKRTKSVSNMKLKLKKDESSAGGVDG
ncbi:unnamed protein product [Ambrosiozyma monospora]|uniref:Unnamed protein product n=1 Tax=Ambrosiozyma monospora TaxID=43982 RepID=A0A9W7DG96_AMBMO|nr:unnamed protein product [Ambrosiozyma monospora]